MKPLSTKTSLLSLATIGLLIFAACENNELAKPLISNIEFGSSHDDYDDHIAFLGAEMHVEAEIVAEGKIDYISVELHPEGDEAHEEDSHDHEIWAYDSTYTEGFTGLKNTTFHKHIEIPLSAEAGAYHFHFAVVDMEGNQVSFEAEVVLETIDDDETPVISINEAPESEQPMTTGDSISIAGKVTDNMGLSGLLVALVYESDMISDEDVLGDHTSIIVLLHTHDFEDPMNVDFAAQIEVGANLDNNMIPTTITGANTWKSGNYYILVKGTDANGNWAYSDHYPIVLNL
jgi:hypothetical protein